MQVKYTTSNLVTRTRLSGLVESSQLFGDSALPRPNIITLSSFRKKKRGHSLALSTESFPNEWLHRPRNPLRWPRGD